MNSSGGAPPAHADCSNPEDSTVRCPSEGERLSGQVLASRATSGSKELPLGWMARRLRNRFIRFLLVGGLNTVFAYTVFALFILVGTPYPLAALVSTVLSVLFNFKSYGALVFGSHDNRLIVRFFAIYALCYLVGLVPLAWARSHGVSVLLVAAVGALPMAGLAFTLQRALVFRSQGAPFGVKFSG